MPRLALLCNSMSRRCASYRPRYAACGLVRNPFCVPGELADGFLALPSRNAGEETTWLAPTAPPLIEVIGDPGQGKSTLLGHLRRRAEAAGLAVHYHYLPPRRDDRWPSLGSVELFLVDEAQRLRRRERRLLVRFLRKGGHIITATHRPWCPRGIRRHEIRLEPPTRADVAALLWARINQAASGSVPELPAPIVDQLARRATSLIYLEQLAYELFQQPVAAKEDPWGIEAAHIERAAAQVQIATRIEPAPRCWWLALRRVP